MKTYCIALLLLVTCSMSLAQQADMKTLRARYDTSLAVLEAQAVTNNAAVLASYKAELQTLKGRVQQAGDLEKTKAVLTEIARFQAETNLPVAAGIPEIKALVSACQTRQQALDVANARSVAVLAAQYDNALAALQRKLVQAGKLDEATAVQTERNVFTNATAVVVAARAATAPTPSDTPNSNPQAQPSGGAEPVPNKEPVGTPPLVQSKWTASTLAGTQWTWHFQGNFEQVRFLGRGVVLSSRWPAGGAWKLEPDGTAVVTLEGVKHVLTFEGNTYSGRGVNGIDFQGELLTNKNQIINLQRPR